MANIIVASVALVVLDNVKKNVNDIFDIDLAHSSPVKGINIEEISNKFESLVLAFKVDEKYELIKSNFDILNSDYTKKKCILCSKNYIDKGIQNNTIYFGDNSIQLNDKQLICVIPSDLMKFCKSISQDNISSKKGKQLVCKSVLQNNINKFIIFMLNLDKLCMDIVSENVSVKIDSFINICFDIDVEKEWGEITSKIDYTYNNLITKNIFPD